MRGNARIYKPQQDKFDNGRTQFAIREGEPAQHLHFNLNFEPDEIQDKLSCVFSAIIRDREPAPARGLQIKELDNCLRYN